MEQTRAKRAMLGIAILGMVVLCFLSGFFLGKVRPSGRANIIYSDELSEVVSYLDKYYYKDYDKEEFEKAYIKGGVSSLNDPYTYVYYAESSDTSTSYLGFGIGVSTSSLGYKISSITKNSPADKVGIKKGDYLIGVDDLRMGKNTLSEIDGYLKDANDEVTMYLLRNYIEYSVKIKKELIHKDELVESKLISNTGYIKINQFDDGASALFKEKLKDLESKNITGLIIDVRDNPGGSSVEVSNILKIFLTGNDAFIYLEAKNDDAPVIERANSQNVKKSYDIKVLINENSASASEVFALAMNRVMNYDLIGKTTFGKGIFQQDIKLSTKENAYLHITRGYWYGYNKENIHEKGIDPTIEIDSSYYIPLPISDATYSIDQASNDIKNIELMLNVLGYEVRNDGYFSMELQNILEANYSSTVINKEVSSKIFADYNDYINDINNDKAIQKAISLLN